MTPHLLLRESRLPRHPSLQSWTSWMGGVLTWYFLSEINETFNKSSKYNSNMNCMLFNKCQEPTLPSRLQEDTWWMGGVLTWYFLSEMIETFNKSSKYNSTMLFNSLRNQPLLQDSRRTHGGHVVSWHGSPCQKWMKLSAKAPNIFLIWMAWDFKVLANFT